MKDRQKSEHAQNKRKRKSMKNFEAEVLERANFNRENNVSEGNVTAFAERIEDAKQYFTVNNVSNRKQMFSIVNRTFSKKKYVHSAEIVVEHTFTYKLSAWMDESSQMHCRVKDYNRFTVAESIWDKGIAPSNESIDEFVAKAVRLDLGTS